MFAKTTLMIKIIFSPKPESMKGNNDLKLTLMQFEHYLLTQVHFDHNLFSIRTQFVHYLFF